MPASDPHPLQSADPAVAASPAADTAAPKAPRGAPTDRAPVAEAGIGATPATPPAPAAAEAETAPAPRSAPAATTPHAGEGSTHVEAAASVHRGEDRSTEVVASGELGEDDTGVLSDEGASGPAEHKAEEHEDDQEDERFWRGMAERVIHVRSMHWSLRLITGFALGQLVAVALLLALRGRTGIHLPVIQVGWQEHQVAVMSLGIFVVCLIFLVVAWTFVLTGAIHSPWTVRVLVLGIASYLFSFTPNPVEGLHVAQLALLWLWTVGVGLIAWREADRRGERSRLTLVVGRRAPRLRRIAAPVRAAARRLADGLGALERRVALPAGVHLPLRTMAFVGAWLLVYYGTLLASVDWGRGNALFPTTISLQIEALSFFLVPVLFLAGTDYAEVGEVLAARLARAVPAAWPLVALTVVAAVIILWRALPEGAHSAGAEIASVASQLVIGGLLLAALIWVARWGRIGVLPRQPLPYVALIAGTLLFVLVGISGVQAVVARQAQPRLLGSEEYAVYTHSAPDFSFVYPKAWTASVSDDPALDETAVLFNGVKSQYPGDLAVVSYPRAVGNLSTVLEAKVCPPGRCQRGASVSHGAWSEQSYDLGSGRGWFWQRAQGSRAYFVTAFVPGFLAGPFKSSLYAVVDSWRPDSTAGVPAEPGLTDQQVRLLAQLMQGAMAVIALVGGLALLWLGRRRGLSALTLSGAFVTVLGLVWLAFKLSPLAQLVGLPAQELAFTFPSVQLVTAAATLLLVGLLVLRRRLSTRERELLTLVFALNAGLQFVAWIIAAFDQSLAIKLSIGQAIILVIGIGWDVLMSGEQITNPDGRLFPRQVRLLLYLGYTMLVTTAVLYFTAEHIVSGGGEPFFEDAQWPQLGLIFLGAPLLITVFIVELSRWWRRRAISA